MNNFTYEADWRKYVYEPQQAKLATKEEIAEAFTPVNFTTPTMEHGGIPLISDGKKGVVIDNENMSLVFGSTGSGKTRLLASEVICSLAKAGESMIIVDQKGSFSSGRDLAPYIRGTLEEQKYNTIFLDFKDFSSGGLNILGPAYNYYKAGKISEAKTYIDKIMKNLVGTRLTDAPKDAMWTNLAVQYIKAVAIVVAKYAPTIADFNFQSIKHFMNPEAARILGNIVDELELDPSTIDDLKSVCSAHHNGITSVMITASEMLAPMTSNEKMLKTITYNTFAIDTIYKEKTALFIILPEDGTYNFMASIVLGIIMDKLNDEAYRNADNRLPRRVNIVADEFPNYTLDKMRTRISTDRSKNIRWYLFCQGLKQLEKSYPNDYETILANCTNWFYLGSPELELLDRLSAATGIRTDNPNGWGKPLISTQALRGLKITEQGKQFYFTDGKKHFVGCLPDITQYTGFYPAKSRVYKIPTYRYPFISDFSIKTLKNIILSQKSWLDDSFNVDFDD